MLGMRGEKEEEEKKTRWMDEVETIIGSPFYSLMNDAQVRNHWKRGLWKSQVHS
jgi:hypothetical protein